MSKGLPPPEPPDPCEFVCWPDFEVAPAPAAVVLVEVLASFFEVVLAAISVDCGVVVVDEAAADTLSVLCAVLLVSVLFGLVVFADVECVVRDAGVFCAAVEVPNTTPGLAVGIVTETAAEPVSAMAEDVLAAVVVAFAATVGHNACIIPPFITIPNNVFELTETSEQALLTSLATEVSAD